VSAAERVDCRQEADAQIRDLLAKSAAGARFAAKILRCQLG